jgi:hypothetical protein
MKNAVVWDLAPYCSWITDVSDERNFFIITVTIAVKT